MSRAEGKVVFITGAARGMGRSHAVRFAEEGADIIAVDICSDVGELPYSMGTPDDLAETVRLVEAAGGRVVARQADVRDPEQLAQAAADGVAELGSIDVVLANAGIVFGAPTIEVDVQRWRDVIDVNLNGVFYTIKAALPSMIAGGRGGSIAITSSIAGRRGYANLASYTASKHGVVGLMRSLANELNEHRIRVNCIHPTNTATDMLLNDASYHTFARDLDEPTQEDAIPGMAGINLIPVPWIEPRDISNALVWLASDEARFVTGISLPVDAGSYVRTF
ncbi:MAG TPA: mycofactocin-coupled SDR family oxidoreductase [Nocardioides sp.]|uniref:mycofactocin-coupled SDR family oxidoreductase n=1 Tax=uncultured Nocardioides sp. TaxID=198441 RepID=UPI00260F09C4|nr:mycofactocin-coupled SDR family oxidoreductase [uncultured Nocardioides sp.]HRD59615.1 mycofactocin-coupled SDR family oxidoreductase [Nocardioides sp.]HRI94236.1 mycofactocin-coupled SDR family oxidoreductase [Nocardioides sp.]HRK44311.1 mycofactocin-coupled SDR family oxidoreductase [Nocardioides sp.]